ncbi:hypothetical protein MJA45_22830 [Paenibacillus aurantius]|uniref:Polysaccharide biosynthesis protein n=1 Tax=Paenibacillus aurantius TaxID=2918900 RepID=A0AA96RGU6_9BACL|nr:hypothetical protein [Paenibacillus aurantius]WNQ10424.1 hypothetical protein MJA45_22830 [Paenibacillus aurantius]
MKRDFIVVLVGRIIQTISAIIVLRVMSSVLTSIELAKAVLVTTITNLFALVSINPVQMFYYRKLNDWLDNKTLGNKFLLLLIYVIVINCFLSAVLLCLYGFFGSLTGIDIFWLLTLVSGSIIFITINQTVIPTLNMLEKRREAVLFTIITTWSSLLLSTLLTYHGGKGEHWILGQIIGAILGSFFAFLSFFKFVDLSKLKQIKKYYNQKTRVIKMIAVFSIPISITVGLNWLQLQSYRFYTSKLVGLEYLGKFSAGYTLSAGIMSAFEAVAMQFFSPIFYKGLGNSNDEKKAKVWNDYAAYYFPLAILTASFVVTMAPYLTRLLLHKTFWDVSIYVIWGAIIELFRILGNAYSMVSHATMKTNKLIHPQLIGAIVALLLVPVMLIYNKEYLGLSLVISSFIYLIVIHKSMTKQLAIQISFKMVIKVLGFVFPMIVISYLGSTISYKFIFNFLLLMGSGLFYLLGCYFIYLKSRRI